MKQAFAAGIVLLFALGGLLAGCSDSTDPEDIVTCTDDPGFICTWAGDGFSGFNGDGHRLIESSLYQPIDLTFAPDGETYVLDWNNHSVRRVTAQGTFETVIGTPDGEIPFGDGPFPGSGYSDLVAPGAPGTEVALNHPTDMLSLPDGTMLLVAWHNHKLRTYDPSTGLALVTCGSGAGYGGDGGPAVDALVNQPSHAVVTDTGVIYLLDQRNHRIRKIDLAGVITTVVGTGVAGFSGDGGSPLAAQLEFHAGGNPPTSGGLALDDQGRVYISDTLNHRIRRVDFGADLIETIAGTGDAGYNGDEMAATQAWLNNPRDLEFGPDGRLYLADRDNHRVRAIDLDTQTITTVAGTGNPGFAGDGGPAVDACINGPAGLAFDPQGRLYIADFLNHRIRRVNLQGATP